MRINRNMLLKLANDTVEKYVRERSFNRGDLLAGLTVKRFPIDR